MLALQHMLYLGIVSWVLRFCSCLFLKKKKKAKKTQPAAGVNGAYGQCSQIPRERRGLELCSRTVIKHDLVSKLICNAELNIWWCTVFFFLCPISFIWNGAVSLDGKAVTMTDAFPGGRSAVAKILGGGRGQSAPPTAADVKWCNGLSRVQRACFSACVAGLSSRDSGLCSQHPSDLLVMTVHTEKEYTHTWVRCGEVIQFSEAQTPHTHLVNIMHANVHRNRPANHECCTFALLQMYFGFAFFCAGSLKMSRHKLTVT